MDPKILGLIISAVMLAIEKGVPATLDILNNWEKEEITLEDIQALRGLVRPPEDY